MKRDSQSAFSTLNFVMWGSHVGIKGHHCHSPPDGQDGHTAQRPGIVANYSEQPQEASNLLAMASNLVASLLLVAMPDAGPLLLVAMPFAPSSVLAPSSKARSP